MIARVLRGVRALGAAALVAAPGFAQAPPGPTPTPRPGVTAAEEVTVLTLDVVAVDGKGRPVFGLVPADFEVRVAGKIQTIDFFEPPREAASRTAGAPKEGRPDSEERLAGSTVPLDGKGPIRHVLVWVDVEQLPRQAILDTAAALHKAFDHAPAGRYGFATHYGGTSARVWDAGSADVLLDEADRMILEITTETSAELSRAGQGAPPASYGAGVPAPLLYETRKLTEDQLIRDYIATEIANGDMRQITQAISQYLYGERERVKRLVLDLRETAERLAALDGPRHLFYVSTGFEKIPGFDFLARLQAEESARVKRTAAAVADPFSLGRGQRSGSPFPAVPGTPGADREIGATRFAFNSSPLLEAEDLARWLASSGVVLHYIDPGGLGRGLPTAQDKYAFSSTLRQDEQKNQQETPLRYVSETGGLSRVSTNDVGGALADLLDATAATYRVGVRLQGIDPKKTYSVKVATRKAGVNLLARNAFKPATASKGVASASLTEEARRAAASSRADDRKGGAARLAKKAIPVEVAWKGRASTPSDDPGRPYWKLEVRIPHEELRFETESDAFVASVKIAVEAVATEGSAKDVATDDWFLSYSGAEYKEVRDTPAARDVLLQLPPGKYALTVSVTDALANTFGQTTLRVEAR